MRIIKYRDEKLNKTRVLGYQSDADTFTKLVDDEYINDDDLYIDVVALVAILKLGIKRVSFKSKTREYASPIQLWVDANGYDDGDAMRIYVSVKDMELINQPAGQEVRSNG